MTGLGEIVDRLTGRRRPIHTLERWDRARALRAWARQVTRQYDESAARVAEVRERVSA